MSIPDEHQLRRSQMNGDAIQAQINASSMSSPMHVPPGLYAVVCDVACRFKQGGSAVKIDITAPTPTVSPQGALGGTTYGYKIVAKANGKKGGKTAAGSQGSTVAGAAVLSTSNFNRVGWAAVGDAQSYDVWRTAGGATQGKIASDVTGTSFDDTGLVADGATAPSASTIVGNPHPGGGTYIGDIWIDGEANAYFDAKTLTGNGTFELVPFEGP